LAEIDVIQSTGFAEQGHSAERKKRAPADARRYVAFELLSIPEI